MRIVVFMLLVVTLAGCTTSTQDNTEAPLADGDVIGHDRFHQVMFEATVPWYDTSDTMDTALRAVYIAYVAAGAFCFASTGEDQYVFDFNKQLPMPVMEAPNGTNQIAVFLDWGDTDYMDDHLHLAWHVAGQGWELSPRLMRGEETAFSIERVVRDLDGPLVIDEAWLCLADESHDFIVPRLQQGETPPWFIGELDVQLSLSRV